MKPFHRVSRRCLLLLLAVLLFLGCSGDEDRIAEAEEHYRQGMAALEQDKAGEARIHFKNAVQQNPSHARAHYELGLLYLKDQQARSAVQELRAAVDADPAFVRAKRTLATLYYAAGVFSDAASLSQQLIEQGEATPDAYMILGNSLVRLERTAEAVEALTAAEERFPDNAHLKVSLAGALLQAEEMDRARERMEAAAAAMARDLPMQLLLARFYERIHLDGQAEAVLDRLRRDFPDEIAVHLASARFLYQEGRFREAEQLLTRVKDQGMVHPDLFQLLGLLAHRRRAPQEALAFFQEAAERFPKDQRSLMLLADYHVFLKDFEQARKTYEQIAAQWPGLSPVKAKIGELLLAERRFGEAESHVQELLQQDPEYARGYVLKGLLDMEQGRAGQAREEFSRALDLDPKSSEGHFYYGLTFLEEQDYKVSLSEMLKALEENPDSARVRFTLAYIYFKTGQLSSALEELNRILTARPADLKARELRATILVQQRDWDRAAGDFQAILEQRPDAWPIRFQLARVHLAAGRLDSAMEAFRETLDAHDDPILPIEGMVQVLLRKKAYGEALALCDEHLTRRPDSLRLALLKAGVLGARGDEAETAAVLRQAAADHPESDRPVVLLARIAQRRGDTAEAEALYRKAVAINPKGVEAQMGLARLQIAAGRQNEAVATYERMLEQTGGYAPAENDLAYLYASLNRNLDRAMELARSARQKLPGNPDVSDTLGWIHIQRGSNALAQQHLREALDARPDHPLYHYHLGVALSRDERWTEALESLDRALSLGLSGPERAQAVELQQGIREKQRLFGE